MAEKIFPAAIKKFKRNFTDFFFNGKKKFNLKFNFLYKRPRDARCSIEICFLQVKPFPVMALFFITLRKGPQKYCKCNSV